MAEVKETPGAFIPRPETGSLSGPVHKHDCQIPKLLGKVEWISAMGSRAQPDK